MTRMLNLDEAKTQLSALVDGQSVGLGRLRPAVARRPARSLHQRQQVKLPPHHADPFDRMIVAQALAERAIIVSHDRALDPYGGAPMIWT